MPEILLQHPSPALVHLANLRPTPRDLLWRLFTHACNQINLAIPVPLLPSSHPNDLPNRPLYALFASSQDALRALSLSCDLFAVSLVPDSDHTSVSRRDTETNDSILPPSLSSRPDTSSHMVSTTISPSFCPRRFDHGLGDSLSHPSSTYPLSTNPPNPKTTFRQGDWMCTTPTCGAHNFQRNTLCIACGRPRTGLAPLSLEPIRSPAYPLAPTYPLANPSPRFVGRINTSQSTPHMPPLSTPSSTTASTFPFHPTSTALAAAQVQMPSKPPPPQYPPLTPSGRAMSVGGRVRNISRDPLAPCVMYWPDNEPLPEPCQIRPMDSALMTYPPIINTGNKGAAEKQPGDWICGKCNYHNWRRRKVCQTCYPYAEGNGDSIPAPVQAERIALLADALAIKFNVLDLNGVPNRSTSLPPSQPHLTPSSAPPHSTRFVNDPDSSVVDSVNLSPLLPPLSLSVQDRIISPIHQTAGPPMHDHLPRGGLQPPMLPSSAHGSTLLPSFLQDIVYSPAQSPSPTSSSSADLSFDGSSEDAHYVLVPGMSTPAHPTSAYGSHHGHRHGLYGSSARKGSSSSYSSLGRSSASSIWKLDGEETKTLSSSSSSTRTSPTTAFAQALQGAPVSAFSTVTVGANPTDSGTTPKSTGDFWQARCN